MNKEEQLKHLFDDSHKVRFGCVWFDAKDNGEGKMVNQPGSGWYSIEGKSAKRFNSIGDLSNDIKWLTNLKQEIFWGSGAVKHTKLKHSAYLRTDVTQIQKELGLIQPKIPVANVCETISELFTKVMRLAIEFYGLKSFMEKDLHQEIKRAIFPDDKGITLHVDEALSRSYQDLVLCETPLPKDKRKFITLKRPRYYHAKSILDISVPVWENDWEFFSQDDLPDNTPEVIDFLMNKGSPFVAKISIDSFIPPENINVDLSKLLNLGQAIGDGGKPKERNWVCQPELLYLSRFANLRIEAAFVADSYQEIDKKVQLPYLGELSDFSYSLGILSECVWTGLAARSVNPKTRSKSLVSPRACWLKAADRFMTLTSAMMLSSAGFTVNSYGYGGVTLLVEDEKIPQLIEIAPHAGLCVPMNIFEKKKFSGN